MTALLSVKYESPKRRHQRRKALFRGSGLPNDCMDPNRNARIETYCDSLRADDLVMLILSVALVAQ